MPFTPHAFKDPKFIDRFRPIYTPYWVYDIMINGNGVIKGEKEYRKGNYDITEFYDVTFNVESNYDGISYDASSSFNDDIKLWNYNKGLNILTISKVFNESNGVFSSCLLFENSSFYIICVGQYDWEFY